MGTVRDTDFKDVDLHIIAVHVTCWLKIPEMKADNNSNITAYARTSSVLFNK